MGIQPSYPSIFFIAAKSHDHQKCCPQRRCLFWPITHPLYTVFPRNECSFLSKYVHDRYLNIKGLNWDPFLLRSKRHSPVSWNFLTNHYDSSSSTWCIRIHTMPSSLQPVLRKFGLLGSNIARTGEYIIPFKICWIIIPTLASNPSMELAYYKIILGFV